MWRLYCLFLLLILCSCGEPNEAKLYFFSPDDSLEPDLSEVSVYVSSSPYADVLKDCAIAEDETNLCTFETLPLIGHDSPDPTIADVMDRVLVSHEWMAVRFEQALHQIPADMLTLFKGVTAIVIASDIRPSYYWGVTAAIYLDPAYLWLTNAEKATISKQDDFRSDFGNDLQFVNLWRYVKDNDYASDYYPLNGAAVRQINDIVYSLSQLLYHELAHANDFFPPVMQDSIDRQLTPYAAFLGLEDQSIAMRLEAFSPLESADWFGLAEVLFRGESATMAQKSFTATQVGGDFAIDLANEVYSYSSIHEDVAMLFEEAMMKYHFDIDRDIAFTDAPPADAYCDDYVVRWGVRNRLGDALVKPRAEWVVAELLPDEDLSVFFAAFPEPTPMIIGLDWCENLDLGVAAASPPFLRSMSVRKIQPEQLERDMRPPD